MWDFFYGPDLGDDIIQPTIGGRTYDIDVVEGVVEVMRAGIAERNALALGEWEFAMSQGTAGLAPAPTPPDDAPQITLAPPTAAGASGGDGASRDVAVSQLRELSASERSRLQVQGGGVTVSFVGPLRTWISGPEPLRKAVETYLRSEGRRRFPAARFGAILPATASIVLLVLWALIVAQQDVDGLIVAFGSILTAGAVACGFMSTRLLLRRVWGSRRDPARFREGSRAEFRAALLSVRAGILTSVGGALLGAVLLAVIQKVFGIDLS